MMKTILVLFGGCSSEHSVSLQSAHAVLTHLDAKKYQALPVGVTREGRWLYYPGPLDRLPAGDWQEDPSCIPCALRLDRGQFSLLFPEGSREALAFDAAFPVLHGKNGEDGTVQGLLELVGVPLIGCGALSSALCMDKDRAHKLAALAGLRTPKSAVFFAGAPRKELAEAAESLGYPLFAKPLRAGSSFGVSRVSRPEELAAAAEAAFREDSRILLEEAIPGFEVGCAVLGNTGETELTVGAVDEIELSGGFFDFHEKYTLKTSAIHCPARISQEKAAEIQAAARTVYTALDCRCFARADFFLTPEGEIVFNEVNTIPGFTAHSRYPSMMKAAGLEFPALLDRLVELGMKA
ncbi:MAG: D-alanine--D-serine ligase VanG [Oscillibacter sp.]|nr:D-alanine--D-serine ligase VanG [Oscillibacter sp.]